MFDLSPDQVEVQYIQYGLVCAHHCRLPHVKAVGKSAHEARDHLNDWFLTNRPEPWFGLPVEQWWWVFTSDPTTIHVALSRWEDVKYLAIEDYICNTGDVPHSVVSYCPETFYHYPLDKLTVYERFKWV